MKLDDALLKAKNIIKKRLSSLGANGLKINGFDKERKYNIVVIDINVRIFVLTYVVKNVFRTLQDIINRTVQFSESNSILVIGPRGSGKTAVSYFLCILLFLPALERNQ